MYTLKKLHVLDGKSSSVHAGHAQKGSLTVFTPGKSIDSGVKKPDAHLDDVQVGKQVIIENAGQWLNTSPIKEIIDRTANTVWFETQTSHYMLTKE